MMNHPTMTIPDTIHNRLFLEDDCIIPELFYKHFSLKIIITVPKMIGRELVEWVVDNKLDPVVKKQDLWFSKEKGFRVAQNDKRIEWRPWVILGTTYRGVSKREHTINGTVYEAGSVVYYGQTSQPFELRKGDRKSHLKRFIAGTLKGRGERKLFEFLRDHCDGDVNGLDWEPLERVDKRLLKGAERALTDAYMPPLNCVPGGSGRGKKRKHGGGDELIFGGISWDKNNKRFNARYSQHLTRKHITIYYGTSITDAYAALTAEFNKQKAADSEGRLDGVNPRPLIHYQNHLKNYYPNDHKYFSWE